MGYEILFGILEFHSAPVAGIKTDRSLKYTQRFFRLREYDYIRKMDAKQESFGQGT